MNIIDKIIIFHPQVRTWGGKKRLDPADLAGYTPPEDLVSLGNKRIVPRAALRPFEAFKKRLDRTMMKFGIRLIGGYAVAEDSVEALTSKLQEFEDEFNRLKGDFVTNFDQHVEEQVEAYPSWETSIRSAAAEVKADLSSRFTCGYKAYKLVPPGMEGTEDKFISDDEFVTQAAREIAAMADRTLVHLSEQEQLKQTFLNRVRAIRDKVLNLSSLDRKLFGSAMKIIDMALGEMPPKGPIEGRERKLLTSLLLFLRQMNKEPVRTAFLDGDYDAPEALMKAMGYGISSESAPESETDSPESQEAEAETETEEFTWF